MNGPDVYEAFHERSQVVHEAIKGMVHDAACRSHMARHEERLEAQLHQISEEVTEMARRLKENQS